MQKKTSNKENATELNDTTIEVIHNINEWKVMQPRWNALVEQSISPSVFLTYEYLSAAWTTLSQKSLLHILIINNGNNLLGIAPLKITLRKVCGIQTKTVESLNALEKDFFIVLNNEHLFYEALAKYLYKNTHLWHKIEFSHIQSDHPFLEVFRNTFSSCRGIILEEKENLVHTCVNISTTWEDYFLKLKPKFIKKLRNSVKDLCAHDTPRVIKISSPDKILEYLKLYVELEERSWKSNMKSGINRTEETFNTYRAILEACAEKGWTEMTFLAVGSQLIAGGIHTIYKDDFVYLQTVYDHDLNRYNPGSLLMTINVQRAFEKGLKTIHFMGNYQEYKRNWSNYEWQSHNICARERLSGEGLAYYGSRWLKGLASPIYKLIWERRRERVQMEQLPPLKIDIEALSKENIILEQNDIKKVFFMSHEESDKLEDTVADSRQISRDEVERLIGERARARQSREWQRADEIRDQLSRKGIMIFDTGQGTNWKYSEAQLSSSGTD